MADPIRLSVIIPVFNEEERLASTLQRLKTYFESQPYRSRILIVDDGSTDRTVEVAEQAGLGDRLRIVQHKVNRGKGAAVRTGMQESQGEQALFTDADLSTPIEEVEKFWSRIEEGFDVAIGSRGLPDSQIEVHQGFPREAMGRIFNVLVRMLVLPGIFDTQCGFKLFSRKAADAIFAEACLDGWSFDVELLALARRKGFRIAEVPVRWVNSPDTKVKAVSASWRMFRDLLTLRRRFRDIR